MLWRVRSLWGAAAVVLYVGAAALRAQADAPRAWAGLVMGAAALLVGWRLCQPPVHGPDRIDPVARSAARVVATAVAAVLVAQLAPPSASFLVARNLGTGVASVASLIALVRVGSLGGIAARPARGRQLDAAVFASLLWVGAVALGLGRALAPSRAGLLDPVAVDYATVAASLGSVGIGLVAALRLFAQRRFELGVAERAAAALWLGVLCLALGVFAALMSVAKPELVMPASALAAAGCVTAASVSQRPALVSRALRIAASVTMLCAPVVCLAVVAAYKVPTAAGLVLFVTTIVAASLGLLSPRLAALLAPERGRWLQTLDAALGAAQRPEPAQAMVAVLVAIRDGLPRDAEQAALYRLASQDRAWVDRAGYQHTERAEIPERLLGLAAQEPERVLSAEALRYVQVRRPEVRPLVEWLDARGAGVVVLVLDEELCVGALLWPAAGRSSPLSFEEVTALRALGDHLGAAIGSASQLARSRARELEAERAMATAQAEVDGLRATIQRDAHRWRALSEQLDRRARVACYSPAAQAALINAERFAATGLPVALVAAAGVDAVAWAAVVHRASPYADGPLVVVDGRLEPAAGEPVERALARWGDAERSPLVLARGGTLVLLAAQLLDLAVQRYVATGLPADAGLVVVLPEAPGELSQPSSIDAHLGERLRGRAIGLPVLADRAEDLRALALHQLARIGLELRGQPLGLSMRAQALLNEHRWPGNETELESVLLRAALATTGPVVDRAELELGLGVAQHGPRAWRAPR